MGETGDDVNTPIVEAITKEVPAIYPVLLEPDMKAGERSHEGDDAESPHYSMDEGSGKKGSVYPSLT